MNGIKMSDCRFYVDENKRVVVCVVPDTEDLFLSFVEEHFSFPDFNVDMGLCFGKIIDSLRLPRSFMGKAVCADEDEWNEETGRMIAFSRAKDKCYKSFFKRGNMLVQMIDRRLGDMIEIFNDFGLKLEEKSEKLQAKIDERIHATLEDDEE